MNIKNFWFFFVLLFLLTNELIFAAKKNRTRGRKRTSNSCKQRNDKTPKRKLEILGFFHFKKRSSGVACFRIKTCRGKPICVVEKTPRSLRTENLGSGSRRLWYQLVGVIQGKRKLELVIAGSESGNNLRETKFSRSISDVENHPTVFRMCKNKDVFKFGESDNNSNSSVDLRPTVNGTYSQITQLPKRIFSSKSVGTRTSKRSSRKRKSKNRRFKNKRRKNTLDDCMCDMPCYRVCVAPGKANDDFFNCRKFRVSCMFDCKSMDDLVKKNLWPSCLFRKLFKTSPTTSRVQTKGKRGASRGKT